MIEHGSHEPKVAWRTYDAYRARVPIDVLTQGLKSGQWPIGTPTWFVELETRLTDEEKAFRAAATPELKLLRAIFGERSLRIKDVLSRPPDYVARFEEEEKERAKQMENAALEILKELVEDPFEALEDVERRVIRLRSGLEDGRSRTQVEAGREFNPPLSRGQVGRIERGVLSKIHLQQKPKKLRDYLE